MNPHRVTAALASDPSPVVPLTLRVGIRPPAPKIRSTAMLLLNEELARSRAQELQAEADRARLVRRVLAARKWQRRAEQAARMARLTASQL